MRQTARFTPPRSRHTQGLPSRGRLSHTVHLPEMYGAGCSGWACLNSAERFGIIFSISVISIGLLLAYTYCLGRRATSHRERATLRLPGSRRVHRNGILPPNVTLGLLPVAQPWPGYPPTVLHQPVVYSIPPNRVPHAHPYATGGAYLSRPCQGPMFAWPLSNLIRDMRGQIPPQQSRPQTTAHGLQPPAASPWRTHRDASPRQPTLWRRLRDVLRMPVGRASTIASSSGPPTPKWQSRYTYPRRIESSENLEVRGPEEGAALRVGGRQDSEILPNRSHAPDETESLKTNAATVHSDDFQGADDPPAGASQHGRCGREVNCKFCEAHERQHSAEDREGLDESPSIPSLSTQSSTNRRNDPPELHVSAVKESSSGICRERHARDGPRSRERNDGKHADLL